MLIVLTVTMDLGRLDLLLRMLCCTSSRLMCISTVQALQAAVQLRSAKKKDDIA
jgi:hypothetical protein